MIKDANEYIAIINEDDLYHRCKEPANDDVWKDLIENYPDLHIHIVFNKTLSSKVLEYLAGSNDQNVRWHVANKRKLNIDTFELLSRDPDSSVRCCIAYNPKTPKSILTFLENDICEDTFDDGLRISDIAKDRLLMVKRSWS